MEKPFSDPTWRRAVSTLPTPCIVISEEKLAQNLAILQNIQEQSGCKILLAMKAFSSWRTFPILRRVLAGVSVCSLHEARLGAEKFGKEIHAYLPAYRDDQFDKIARRSSHIVFNSFSQVQHYRERSILKGKSMGVRINPECSQVKYPLYDPCLPRSRLGVTYSQCTGQNWDGIEGLHCHALCESEFPAFKELLSIIENRFGEHLRRVQWLNLGGGHLLTRPDYDLQGLIEHVRMFRHKYGLDIYLEPGTAVVQNTAVLVTSVLDITYNGGWQAILDTSAAAHMPDILEMPFRPNILDADKPGKLPYSYQLGSVSCMAGDIIGDYSFANPLKIGDRLVLMDMAHYTMVKATQFNGIRLPETIVFSSDTTKVHRGSKKGYAIFKKMLG
ncbi:MAG: carboxynorspermidine decarboxylase [Magnetococcales bacterium]|nr:carboxynorspermidine decarboxylase [Magnetococcales bacterium]